MNGCKTWVGSADQNYCPYCGVHAPWVNPHKDYDPLGLNE